jgi:imidazolonepropionase-like amidohydrolase
VTLTNINLEDAELMLARGAWLVPTLVAPRGVLAELELMAKGGMEPAQALAAATSSAAELLGVADELGTLEPGKRADVVVVDGDPFELATLSDRIAAVVKDGRLVAGHV